MAFTATDMNAIMDPILDMFWAGLGATSHAGPSHPLPTPADLRKSVSATSSPLPPRVTPILATNNRASKWALVMPHLAALLKVVITMTFIDPKMFDRSLGFMCFAFGQDEYDLRQDGAVLELFQHTPKSRGGRQGELAIRRILENEKDPQVVRGAVM